MKGTDAIKQALEFGTNWTMSLAKDMSDAALTSPTPNGGNHPLWVIGHLAIAEWAFMAMINGEKNPLEKWDALFGIGSQPTSDASKYPSYDELLAEFQKARANTMQALARMSDDDLDRKSHAPPEFADMFGTVGKCLNGIAIHAMFHTGQIADARRALGRKPINA